MATRRRCPPGPELPFDGEFGAGVTVRVGHSRTVRANQPNVRVPPGWSPAYGEALNERGVPLEVGWC